MPKYFKLAAIIVQGDEISLFRIPLRQDLQQNLANDWNDQYNEFICKKEEFDFTLGYTLEENQHFRLYIRELPNWLANQNLDTIPKLTSDNEDELVNFIEGIVAFVPDDNRDNLLFQNFTPSQVIQPYRFLFRLGGDAYDKLEKPGLTLAKKLSAVYLPQKEKLLFRSYRNINTFLPLSDFYYEASEEDIIDILSHKLFECSDKDTLVNNSTQWIRKRFAMLKDSRTLDDYSITRIETRARRYNVEIQVVNDKIIFPTDNAKTKRLLQLLNEEIFQGALTDDLYETNSKKKANL